MNRKRFFELFRIAWKGSWKNKSTIKAAALTFFIILPLPSLLIIALTVQSLFYGPAEAMNQLSQQISWIAGQAVGDLFRQVLSNSMSPFYSIESALTIIGFSIVGAIGTFSVLRDSMDNIWEVKLQNKQQPIFVKLKNTISPFIILLALGFFVFFWTIFSNMIFDWICLTPLQDPTLSLIVGITKIVLSLLLGVFLFGVIYKNLPSMNVDWSDVKLAALLAGSVFTITNYFFGSIVNILFTPTLEGAAGAIELILIWVFVINQILLFGAELSKAHSKIRIESLTEKPKRPQ
jgi:membrane protein